MKKGQRVVLRKTGPAFGSERSAKAVEELRGLEGLREHQRMFGETLKAAGVGVGDKGTVEYLDGDGYVSVKFNGKKFSLDIPEHCLRTE